MLTASVLLTLKNGEKKHVHLREPKFIFDEKNFFIFEKNDSGLHTLTFTAQKDTLRRFEAATLEIF